MHIEPATPTLRRSTVAPPLDDAVITFGRLRPRLLAIAARIVGDRTEAEDIVQDVWVRWQTCDRTIVRNPTAFLVAATTRVAINASQSARVRHEFRGRVAIPEPVDTPADPAAVPERLEALRRGIAMLVERLPPTERAAYVLRQAFDYSYADIARVLDITEINARQLVSRAGKRVTTGPHRHPMHGEPERLIGAFVAAAEHGNVTALEQVLALDDVARRAS